MHTTADTIHTRLRHRRRPAGATTRYHMVRAMVGDFGTVVPRFSSRRRRRVILALLRIAWLPISFLLMAAILGAAT